MPPEKKQSIWIYVALAILTLIVFLHLRHADFCGYDDPYYVINNSHLRTGLTLQNVFWALGTMSLSNWHPLTWLSYMLDYEMFRLNPS